MFRDKLKEIEMRRLMGEPEEVILEEQEDESNNSGGVQKQQEEAIGGDEYFEDIISLKSDDSIVEIQRKRGRPPKHEQRYYQNANDSFDEDDFNGFDDFSFQEKVAPSKGVEPPMLQKKYKSKYYYKKKIEQQMAYQQLSANQKIFTATKVEPTYNFSQIKNLNELSEDTIFSIQKYLEQKKITEYRQLVQILNQQIFEKYLKFTICIDQMPNLEKDGSQTMVLRCFKHH